MAKKLSEEAAAKLGAKLLLAQQEAQLQRLYAQAAQQGMDNPYLKGGYGIFSNTELYTSGGPIYGSGFFDGDGVRQGQAVEAAEPAKLAVVPGMQPTEVEPGSAPIAVPSERRVEMIFDDEPSPTGPKIKGTK